MLFVDLHMGREVSYSTCSKNHQEIIIDFVAAMIARGRSYLKLPIASFLIRSAQMFVTQIIKNFLI